MSTAPVDDDDDDANLFRTLMDLYLVIDGSFCQPLESTRLTRTSNVRYAPWVLNRSGDVLFYLVVAQRYNDSVVEEHSMYYQM